MELSREMKETAKEIREISESARRERGEIERMIDGMKGDEERFKKELIDGET